MENWICRVIVLYDVSRVFFCGPVTTGRNWIGVGSSFDISCVEDFHINVPQDASAAIYVGGTEEFKVDVSHVALQNGTEDTPSLNFGLGRWNPSDGIYFDPTGIIGSGPGPVIAAAGVDRLHVGTSNVVVPINNFRVHLGQVLTASNTPTGDVWAFGGGAVISGNPGGTLGGGLIRGSSVAGADWEDGNCGNSSALVFTPRDFFNTGATRGGRPSSYNVDQAALLTLPRIVSGQCLAAVNEIVATKLIPKGFIVPAGRKC